MIHHLERYLERNDELQHLQLSNFRNPRLNSNNCYHDRAERNKAAKRQAGNGISRRHLKAQNSKMISKYQAFFSTVPKKTQRGVELARRRPSSAGRCRAERGDPLRFFNIHSGAKYRKN